MKFEKVKGFEGLLFGLVLLFLPANLSKHFVFNFAYVEGILVDYLIPTVYLTDILIWGLLGFWGFTLLRQGFGGQGGFGEFRSFSVKRLTKPYPLYPIPFVLLLFVSALSVTRAANQPAAVYRWLKLLEYILFSLYISKNVDLKKDFLVVVKLMSIGVLFESVLAIAQWFKQGSVFGYWFFGENRYTVSTPGIAVFDFFGAKKVRSYGTFPHPNVLGGYLAVVLPWILYELVGRIKNQELGIKGRGFYLLTLVLGLIALFLSFSRSAWVVGFLGLVLLFLILNSSFSFHNSSFLILNSLSFLRRAELNWIALEMIKDHLLLGVGLNNFTVRMSEYGKVSGWIRFLQPVHNVYLLIAAETGLIGLGLFLCLLFSAFRLLWKSKHRLLLVSLAQVVILCLTDHYFFTLQQTTLLFWLILGLAGNDI